MDPARLTPEKPHPATRDIDRRPAIEVVDALTAEAAKVAPAVAACRDRLAEAVHRVAHAWLVGGRLLYVGAGTSGRVALLDAADLRTDFGCPPTAVQVVLAGGPSAMRHDVEGAEDNHDEGREAVSRKRPSRRDVVCCVAAEGLPPYVAGALQRAREMGAATVFVTCAPRAAEAAAADVVICPDVGPEVLAGASRLKGASALKLVLNCLSTAALVKTGRVHGNLMVDLQPVCDRLRDRARRIVMDIAGVGRDRAAALLQAAGGSAKVALVMHLRDLEADEAARLLQAHGGVLRKAIEAD